MPVTGDVPVNVLLAMAGPDSTLLLCEHMGCEVTVLRLFWSGVLERKYLLPTVSCHLGHQHPSKRLSAQAELSAASTFIFSLGIFLGLNFLICWKLYFFEMKQFYV